MADRELAFVSGRTRRLFPRVRFHFWPQRRRYTCIFFLSCELPRSRSRRNSRARQRTDPLRPVNLKLEVAWPRTWNACAGGYVLVDLPMKGFIKTQFQRSWGKVSVDNLVVCQRCRSLWSTYTSNALPHRWWNRYLAQGQGKRSLGGWSPAQRSCPGLRCLKVLLLTPRRFLCSSFVRLCNHRFSSVSCTKLLCSLELPTVDASTFARCITCQGMQMSIRLESACFQTLPRYTLPRS